MAKILCCVSLGNTLAIRIAIHHDLHVLRIPTGRYIRIAMIHASQLTRSYRLGQSCIDAVAGLTFAVETGQRIAIIGRSGSGKSTLLNLLAGLDRPTSGTLAVNDLRLDQLSRIQMAEYRLKTVGVIFQAFQLIPQRTAFQNVELPLILGGVAPNDRRRIADDWLSKVGLLPRRDHPPYQLSGGEQLILLISVTLCVTASLIPAWCAAQLDPVIAMRRT